MHQAHEKLISEEIAPIAGAFDTAAMGRGEPGLPERFAWRGEEHAVAELIESWKQLGPCSSGGGDRYLRRHWFRVRSEGGLEMKLYFERTGRPGRGRRQRWYLYSIVEEKA